MQSSRLQEAEASWREPAQQRPEDERLVRVLGPKAAAELDLFDRAQLAVVLGVCSESASLSDAGRTLFAQSRQRRSSINDADRLRKYLARFDLDCERARGEQARRLQSAGSGEGSAGPRPM